RPAISADDARGYLGPELAATLRHLVLRRGALDRESSKLLLQTTVLRRRRLCCQRLADQESKGVPRTLRQLLQVGVSPPRACFLLRLRCRGGSAFRHPQGRTFPFQCSLACECAPPGTLLCLGRVDRIQTRAPTFARSLAPCSGRSAFRPGEFQLPR